MEETKIVEKVVRNQVPLMRNTLPKERHQELKHYCLQWRYYHYVYNGCLNGSFSVERYAKDNKLGTKDPTAVTAIIRQRYGERIKNIESALDETVPNDEVLKHYLLRAVTEYVGYNTLVKEGLTMPQLDFWQLRIDFFYNLSRLV